MKLATYNVNSIRARKERVLSWLSQRRPDIVCIQELKCTDDQFPHEDLEFLGYVAEAYGQKTYNGVAILVSEELAIEDVRCGFDDGDEEDEQARLIAATIGDVRVVCAYCVNGGSMGSDKYAYKQRWFARLKGYLERERDAHERLILAGDFNIALTRDDVHDHDAWWGGVLYNEEMIATLQGLLELGLVDTFRQHQSEDGHYSWWDYRSRGFERGDGLRIDYVLASDVLSKQCVKAWIDVEERGGDKASDHAPVFAEFDVELL